MTPVHSHRGSWAVGVAIGSVALLVGFIAEAWPHSGGTEGIVVSEKPEGYVISTTHEVIAYGDTRLKNSPDGQFHWCGDWLRELADPGKSQSIFQFCHRWSMVTPHGLVAADELPPGWGHYTFKDGRLRETVMPKRMEPMPPTPGFMAAVVRRAGETDDELLASVYKKVREEEEAKREEEVARRVDRTMKDRDYRRARSEKQLEELEAALGEPLANIYDLKQLASAIKTVRKIGVDRTYGDVGHLLRAVKRAGEVLEAAFAESAIVQNIDSEPVA